MPERSPERRATWSLLARFFLEERRALAALGILTIVASALAAFQPLPLKYLVDQGIGGQPLPDGVKFLEHLLGGPLSPAGIIVLAATLALLLQAGGGLLDARLNWRWAGTGRRMVNALSDDLYHQLLRRSIILHHREGVGDQLSRLSGDTWSVHTAAEAMIVGPPQHLLKLVFVIIVAWQLDPGLTAVMLVIAPLLAVFAVAFGRPLTRRARRVRHEESKLMSFVHQTLGVLPMVQAFGAQARHSGRFRDLAQGAIVASRQRVLTKHLFLLVNGLALAAGTSIVLFAGGKRVLEGAMSLGALLVFLPYLRVMEGSCRALLESWTKMKGVGASVERILERMGPRDRVPEPAVPSSLPPAEGGRAIVFHGVTFGYLPGRPVLEELHMSVAAGEAVAVVGPTGSGKSTLAGLVLRLFDPERGSLQIDGVDVRDLSLAALRKEIAYVPQEPSLLPGTVAENIAYGAPGASREAIVQAARDAHADAFIAALPEGYDTRLEERASSLSGGQRQRIAIARAFLKPASILILDEATSALDEPSESVVVSSLAAHKGRRTIVAITHRPALLRIADRVLAVGRRHEVTA